MKTTTCQLPNDIDALKNKVRELEEKNRLLTEQVYQLVHRHFGRTTEKYQPNQLDLFFDEAEQAAVAQDESEAVEVPAHSRKKRGRVALSKDLPRVEVIHELAEGEQVCDNDGHALHKIGEETSEQLEIIPAKVRVIRHIRYKYACRHCEQTIKMAPLPKQPIPKSIASPGLLAHVAVSKYQDALPLYRQEAIIKRYGIELPRATLANWMIKAGELLTPIINLMREQLHAGPLIYMDETRVQVLSEPGKTATSNSQMWVQVGGLPQASVRLFTYSPSRSATVARKLLGDFSGLLMTDGYQAYDAATRHGDITLLDCWAHARRKFMEAKNAKRKQASGKADMALSLIQKLYAIERSLHDASPQDRYFARQQQARPVIDKLRGWLDKSLPQVLPKSALGKALHYLNNQWVGLVRYLDNGLAPIDNNPAENAIRPFVIGRKNWLFSQSVKGAEASAALYSIIETAKAHQLEPFDYLAIVFARLPNAQSIDDIEALLPWNVIIR